MEPAKTILLFGSFNPIHRGHLAIAENVLREIPGTEVWFVVSPQNPFKDPEALAPEQHRLQMARLAVDTSPLHERMAVSGIEFEMQRPSLTIRTLDALQQKYPSRQFALLMGTDLVEQFGKWYRSDEISDRYEVMVYPRGGKEISVSDTLKEKFTFLEGVPTNTWVATDIRHRIDRGENPENDLPPGVWEYIKTNGLYGNGR